MISGDMATRSQIQRRHRQSKRNLQSNQDQVKRGSASIVASIKSIQSRQIVQLMVNNVAVVKK